MTLPSSPNSIAMSQVNTELSRNATALINLNDSEVRTLAGVGGSGTTIAMQNLRGKSAVALQFNGDGASFFSFAGGEQFAEASITLRSNGSITITTSEAGQTTAGPTAYLNPITTNAGAGFEYRLNVTGLPVDFDAYNQPQGRIAATGFTAWHTIDVDRQFWIEASFFDSTRGADGFYGTLEIRNKTTLQTISRGFDLEIELY